MNTYFPEIEVGDSDDNISVGALMCDTTCVSLQILPLAQKTILTHQNGRQKDRRKIEIPEKRVTPVEMQIQVIPKRPCIR